jgi:hypothetical protein
MGKAKPGKEKPSFDPDKDRYPELEAVLSAVLASDEIPSGPIERLEVTSLASGEATARVWTPRAEEPLGLYFGPDEWS